MDYIKDIILHMESRMENMRIFYPFFKIHRNFRDSQDRYYIPSLCIAVLSFLLYEGKLKYKNITLKDICEFLKIFITESYKEELKYDEIKKCTVMVLDNLQNYGNNFKFKYYSYISNSYKEKFVKLIGSKIEDNNILYYITKDGIDFFLKTKEFPEEAQITINLLLFRKQINSGSFEMALETLNRLNMEVQRKLERKNTVLDLMIYGGKDSIDAYKNYYVSVESQIEEERELFGEIKTLIRNIYREYIGKMEGNAKLTRQEQSTFNYLKEIQNETDKVIELHFRLLKEAVGLSGEYEKILSLRRQSPFSEHFAFETEFTGITEDIDKPEALKFIMEPLFMPYIKKSFNPLNIFCPQKLIYDHEKDSYEESEKIDKIEHETIDDIVKKRVSSNFTFYGFHMLKMFEKTDNFDLTMWVEELIKTYGNKVICNGDFIAYLIELNHGKDCGNNVKEFRLIKENESRAEASGVIESILKDIFRKENISTVINNIYITSEPDTYIDLNYGIKVNNLIFRGM